MNYIHSIKTNDLIAKLDHTKLHRYILNVISNEFANMVENCYYPKVSRNSKVYRDLLYMTQSKEAKLTKYAKEKYTIRTVGNKSKSRFLYDPYTTLLILIVQDFIDHKDITGAQSTFNLFALRYYTNLLYRGTTPRGSHSKICNDQYFQSALDRLSNNHMFMKQKTIANSVMYYSRQTFQKYMKALASDDTLAIATMIIELRTRLAQSMRSFFKQYYKARDEKDNQVRSKNEMDYDVSHEKKLKAFISRITKDLCVYGKIDKRAIENASSLLKFNKKLSVEYSKKLSNPKYVNEIEVALFLLLRDVKDVSYIKKVDFLDHVKKLLSIKVTNKTTYFKKSINDIHLQIIDELKLNKWYDNLSIQSKSISRNYIAYYLAFYIKEYI